MATVNLGSIKFNWQGAYNGATAYAVDDVVSYNGSSYICKLASTGNLPTNTTYFDQMSSAGTNGTDLTSTLTTQGDLVYRDGSGLQRLGAGTAGQVLQTGGAGANPSWGTVSSDFVKLAEGNNINTASYSIDGYYSSTYPVYKYIFTGILNSNSNNDLHFRTNQGGVAETGAAYRWSAGQAYKDSSGTSSWGLAIHSWNGNQFRFGGETQGSNALYSTALELNVYDPLSTTSYKNYDWKMTYLRYDGFTFQTVMGGGVYATTSQQSGITIYFTSSGNFVANSMRLYGLK